MWATINILSFVKTRSFFTHRTALRYKLKFLMSSHANRKKNGKRWKDKMLREKEFYGVSLRRVGKKNVHTKCCNLMCNVRKRGERKCLSKRKWWWYGKESVLNLKAVELKYQLLKSVLFSKGKMWNNSICSKRVRRKLFIALFFCCIYFKEKQIFVWCLRKKLFSFSSCFEFKFDSETIVKFFFILCYKSQKRISLHSGKFLQGFLFLLLLGIKWIHRVHTLMLFTYLNFEFLFLIKLFFLSLKQ